MREAVETLKRRVAAPAPLVWALVADTNRFDRAAGLVAGSYRFAEQADGSRERVAQAKQNGFRIEWIEPAYDWVEGRFVRGSRKFIAGPAKAGGFSVDLTPDGDGTIVEARAWVGGTGIMGFVARAIMRPKFKAALRRYLDAMETVLKRAIAQVPYNWADEPPAAACRRALLIGESDALTSGVQTPNRESDFDFRARRFESAPVEPEMRRRVLDFLKTRPDEEVAVIRPFEVARAWGVDRREVLRTFLHAARAGLVELQWQLNCPSCRVGSASASSLDEVGRQAHCDACNINYDLDFGEHVEAIFKISPSIRTVETSVYCASSPWFRPHVFGQITVEPGKTVETNCALPPGSLLVRTLRHGMRGTMEVTDDSPGEVEIVLGKESIAVTPSGARTSGRDTALRIVNEGDRKEVVLLERTGWSADIVLGSVIATLPDFLDLFATEAPAAGVELSVSALTLLFSDLTGSTALYERVGDARAFAIVEEHFRDMQRVIGKHGGAIVKTMGDAVMATFASPADAMEAAVAMIAECERAHGELGLSVKLGLHEGPCLAVRANDKLDYFGTTVNVAARLQAQANGSEIVIAAELMGHAGVANVVRDRRFPMERFEAHLKGIKDVQKLLRFDVSSRASGASAKKPLPSEAAS